MVALGIGYGETLAGRPPTEDEIEPLSRAVLEHARTLSSTAYLTALAQLQLLARHTVAFFADYDVLLTPVLATRPLPIGELHGCGEQPLDDLRRSGRFAPYTALFNVTGQPALSMPAGFGEDGLPSAVQLVGHPLAEETLLQVAAQLEAARPWAGAAPRDGRRGLKHRGPRRGSRIPSPPAVHRHERLKTMAYVIAEPCIGTKDNSCVEVCPVDCIHPTPDEPDYDKVEQLYIDPDECIDCDACVEACPVDACFAEDQVPDEWAEFTARNAAVLRRGARAPGGRSPRCPPSRPSAGSSPPAAARRPGTGPAARAARSARAR